MLRAGRRGWQAAAMRRVLAAVVVLAGLVVPVGVPVATGASAAPPRACNGRPEYCARRLDEIAIPTTHNSNAARDSKVLFPNQRHTMARQLRDGIRGFQIDAFLGSVRRTLGHPVVFTDLGHLAQSRFGDSVGPEATRVAQQLRRRVGRPPSDAPEDVFLCHNYCELGAVRMLDEAKTLDRFLQRHRNEVVVWIVQDELPAERLESVLRASGLAQRLATLDPSAPLPTLGELIERDRRLVVGLERGDLGPAIPNVFDRGLVQEVPFRYERVADLRGTEGCRPRRGRADAPLFQFNHWITPASRDAARRINAYDFLLDRARRCAQVRHHLANLVAVDFAETGALRRVTTTLNREAVPAP